MMIDGDPAQGGGAKRVLLIEDEPHITEAIRFILSRDGWQVIVHASGRDAAGMVRDRAPHVVILDVMLPERSGYDVLADLRADAATAHVPVLVLTARGQATERETALRLGADRFMAKPFSNDEIVAAVRELGAERARTP